MLGAVLLFAIGAELAAAERPPVSHPTFARTPDRGLPGAVIQVSGADCNFGGRPWEEARVSFRSLAKTADGTTAYVKLSDSYPIRDDGTWSGDWVVPADAPLGEYTIAGVCYASDMDSASDRLPFTVGEPLPTTTSPPPELTTTVPVDSATTTIRPSANTSTTSPVPATTSTSEPVAPTTEPPPAAGGVAAPTTDTRPGRRTPFGLMALAGLLATGAGAAATRTVRRRRR